MVTHTVINVWSQCQGVEATINDSSKNHSLLLKGNEINDTQ